MRFLLRGLVALLLVIGVAACSDDGDGGEEARDDRKKRSTTTTTVPTLDADQIDADASPFCGTWAEIKALGGPATTGTPETVAENRKEHYAELVPLAERLVEQADDEIKSQAEFALEQVREVARTGSDEPFMADEASTVQQELAAYVLEHCAKD